MPIKGRAIGENVFFVEDLDNTYGMGEIIKMNAGQFHAFCGFLSEKEGDRLLERLERVDGCGGKCTQILSILSKVA